MDGNLKAASEIMYEVGYDGISYPTNSRTNPSETNKNYVVFSENDINILDKVRCFRTNSGEAYGFTVGGKIYIDPEIATAETPIHEYSHLWVTALQKGNPEEWEHVKEMFKKTPIWNEVKRLYPNLQNEDELAD